MQILAYDKELNLLAQDVPFFNLQWNRRYCEAGDFSIQILASMYDPNWLYIRCDERDEVGVIRALSYTNNGGEKLLTLSGFFAEGLMNELALVKGAYDTQGIQGIADSTSDVVGMWFQFSEAVDKKGFILDQGRSLGTETTWDFEKAQLGNKVYEALNYRGLGIKFYMTELTSADWEGVLRQIKARVYQGLDRTAGQTENDPAIFSAIWGNLEGETVSIDRTDYKNVCIVSYWQGYIPYVNTDGTAPVHTRQMNKDIWANDTKEAERFETGLYKLDDSPYEEDPYATAEEAREAIATYEKEVEEEARELLDDKAAVVDINVSVVADDQYRKGYDLGDKCTIILEDIGLDLEARIVEVNEVWKSSGHEVTLGFGSKRISNIRRALQP